MPNWVDAHCHLQLMDDPHAALDRARDVSLLVLAGVDAPSSAAALELRDGCRERLRAAAGLHPHNATRWPAEAELLAALAERAEAVGETGLDLYRDLAPRRQQLETFEEQLRLAVQLDKPVVVHCRDAFREVYDSLAATDAGDRAILHCWSGGPNWTRRFLAMGVAFSFTGPVMLGSDAMVLRGAALIPPDRVLIESDTPHFCSEGSGHQGEPADVALVGGAFARLWGVDSESAARTIAASTRRAYRL